MTMLRLIRELSSIMVLLILVGAGARVAGAAVPVPAVTLLSPLTEGAKAPLRLAADASGNIYVTDPRSGGILRYSPSGRLLQVIRTARAPQGVAVTSTGRLVVGQGDHVSLLDPAGTEIRKLGSGAGQFRMANGIALDGAGRIYVVDSLAHCVKVFSAAGDYVTSFGSPGSGSGMFNMPTGIAFEKVSGHLAVVDTLNGRIQFFDTNGVYQRTLCSFGSGPLRLSFPQGVAFEYGAGTQPTLLRMYVVDSFQSSVQVIDPSAGGAFISFVGSYGGGGDELSVPADLLFDTAGSRLVVSDGAGRLVLFGIGTGYVPVDTTPPALTLDLLPQATSASQVAAGGTVEPGAVVTVALNGGQAAAALVSGTAWSATLNLAVGTNSLVVRATDVAGNVTTVTAAVLRSAAVAPFTVNAVPGLVGTNRFILSGTRGAGVTLTAANVTTGSSTAVTYPGPTTWQADLSGLAEGNNLVTMTAGGSSLQATLSVDTQAPVLTVSTLETGTSTAGRILNVTIVAQDPNLEAVTVNGTPAFPVNGIASAAVPLVNGPNTVTVRAVDAAGHATFDARSITFAPTVPELAIIAPSDGTHVRTPVVELSGTAATGATVTVGGVPATMSNGGWSRRVTLAPGLNTIEVRATTPSGGTAALKRSVFYGASAPQVVIAQPAEDQALSLSAITLTGMSEDGVILSAHANGVAVPVTLSGSTFSVAVPLAGDGPRQLAITATEPGGASTTAIRNVLVDRTPPQLLITGQTTPPPSILTGTADRDATLTISDRNGTLATLAPAAATWSASLAGTFYDPSTLRVAATDSAGNVMVRTLGAPLPTGDLTGDGVVNIADVLQILRIAVGIIPFTADDFAAGDVGPLVNGEVHPDGLLDLRDAVLVLRKFMGMAAW